MDVCVECEGKSVGYFEVKLSAVLFVCFFKGLLACLSCRFFWGCWGQKYCGKIKGEAKITFVFSLGRVKFVVAIDLL